MAQGDEVLAAERRGAGDGMAVAAAVAPPLAGISRKQIRNRRLRYLALRLDGTDYFSDAEMRERDPRLYHEYVGRFIPESERTRPFPNDMTLVQRIYSMCDERRARDALEEAELLEAEAEEEEEEEEDGEEEEEKQQENEARQRAPQAQQGESAGVGKGDLEPTGPRGWGPPRRIPEETNGENGITDIGNDVREELREELVRLMKEKFLSGLDNDFDYALCDLDPEFDDLAQMQRDTEDAYFDSLEEEYEQQSIPQSSTLGPDEYDY